VQDAAAEFSQLLDREREAALRADVEGLAELQESKRHLFDRVRKGELSGEISKELVARAHANIGLIRSLVNCLRGCLGGEPEATYTSKGLRSTAPDGSSRGVL
jgi:hypothetical protein